MAKITVIGWYGTETIGDRAILSGIFHAISELKIDFEIALGALFEPLSQRTIIEDRDFFTCITANRLKKISVFHSLNQVQLKQQILSSDLLIVGGGPLMDIESMYLLEYAFGYAKSNNVPAMLAGCGWGPLKNPSIIKSALQLIKYSSSVVFRDQISQEEYLAACNTFNIKPKDTYSSIDPAFFASSYYSSLQTSRNEDIISVNFRDLKVDNVYSSNDNKIEEYYINLLSALIHFEKPILLIPMHTFHIGGDDRILLSRLCKKINLPQVIVQQNPLSLEETMSVYYNSFISVGMRFHAVVLQTVLNGKNYILDYTHPEKGKTIGMLKELQLLNSYKDRYFSLHKRESFIVKGDCARIKLVNKDIDEYKCIYINEFRKFLSR